MRIRRRWLSFAMIAAVLSLGVVNGTTAHIATTVISPTTTTTVKYVGSVGGGVGTVTVQGNLAYIGEGGALSILDISNPAVPVHLGSFRTSGYVEHITVVGQRAYLAARSAGLLILDVSNPTLPVLVDQYTGPSSYYYVHDVQVSGTLAYVAANNIDSNYNSGLQILDISHPNNPVLLGIMALGTGGGGAYRVQVANNIAYLANGDNYLVSIDVSKPSALRLLATAIYPLGPSVNIQVVGNLGYDVSSSYGLGILNLSDPYLSEIGDVRISGGATAVSVAGNRAYVTSYAGDLIILDVTDPLHPVTLGTFQDPGSSLDVQVINGRAYIAHAGGGLQIVNVSSPAQPVLLGTYHMWSAENVQLAHNRAYIASGTSGVQIVDVSNPATPTQIGHFDTSGSATWAQPVGNLIFVTNAGIWNGTTSVGASLQIVKAINPAHPVLVGSYQLPDSAQSVQVVGTVAYVATYAGFFIFDVTNPAAPSLLANFGTPYSDYVYVQVIKNVAYLLVMDNGLGSGILQVLDVHNPSSPTLLGSYTYLGPSHTMQITGNLAYISDGSGIVILNISNPAAIRSVGAYQPMVYVANGIRVVNGRAYLAEAGGDLEIVDVHDPAHPTSVTRYVTDRPARDVQVLNGRIYVADDDNGLQILTTSSASSPIEH